MWIHVSDCNSGAAITNASFSGMQATNNGGGWYWMYSHDNQPFTVNAPGYYSVAGNTDYYTQMSASLCPAPPPGGYGNCWS
jgi:hypothetical protein